MTRRKTPESRQRRNTVDAGPLELVPSTVDRPVPPAPKIPGGGKLRAEVRDWWADFWRSPLAELVDRTADVHALRRLALLYDERIRAESAYRKAPTSTGSTGQLTLSPFAREIASLDGRILSLEDRFGLSPKSRLDLGAQLGAAAHGLEQLNRAIEKAFSDDDEDGQGADDPRLRAIEAEAEETG